MPSEDERPSDGFDSCFAFIRERGTGFDWGKTKCCRIGKDRGVIILDDIIKIVVKRITPVYYSF